jgi:hypothetical protein
MNPITNQRHYQEHADYEYGKRWWREPRRRGPAPRSFGSSRNSGDGLGDITGGFPRLEQLLGALDNLYARVDGDTL